MTQAPATPELVERLNEHVRYEYMPASARLAMEVAADALEAQQARIAELEGGMKAALREVSKHAREAGEAIGRLEMSESAGILAGWRERAEAAEALADRFEKALREIYRVGDGYGPNDPPKNFAGTTGEGHARCREIARQALQGDADAGR